MQRSALSMDVKVGESVSILDGAIVVTVEAKSGQRARLRFDAQQGTDIRRVEPRVVTVAAHHGTNHAGSRMRDPD